MTLRSFALAFVLAFLAGAISAPVSADQSCPSKLFAREVVEGGFQGIVCDQYCRLHLSLGNGQSAEFIAAGAVQDFETGGGEKVRVTVEDLQIQDGATCLRDKVATSIRLASGSAAVQKDQPPARKKAPAKKRRPRRKR